MPTQAAPSRRSETTFVARHQPVASRKPRPSPRASSSEACGAGPVKLTCHGSAVVVARSAPASTSAACAGAAVRQRQEEERDPPHAAESRDSYVALAPFSGAAGCMQE